MDIDRENIEDLKNNDSALENTPLPEKKVDEHGRAYATGKRKNAVARVWLKPGSGIIKINGKISDDYFARPVLRMLINQPLVAAERVDQFDVTCSVTGGGYLGKQVQFVTEYPNVWLTSSQKSKKLLSLAVS